MLWLATCCRIVLCHSVKLQVTGANAGTLASFPAIDASKAATVLNQCATPGMFAITLDDGPAVNTAAALAALKEKNAVATFFVNGHNQVDLNTDTAAQARLKDIYAAGHQVGSHTYTHADLASLSVDAIWTEMQSNDDLIFSLIGVRPIHVRLPFLSGNQQVYDALGSWGYRIAGVNLDTRDFEHSGGPTELADNMANFNTAMDLKHPSYIALNHDFTAQIGPWISQMVDAVRARGFKLVTIHECLGDADAYRNAVKQPPAPTTNPTPAEKQQPKLDPTQNARNSSSNGKLVKNGSQQLVVSSTLVAFFTMII